jgi:hypothetical protein
MLEISQYESTILLSNTVYYFYTILLFFKKLNGLATPLKNGDSVPLVSGKCGDHFRTYRRIHRIILHPGRHGKVKGRVYFIDGAVSLYSYPNLRVLVRDKCRA